MAMSLDGSCAGSRQGVYTAYSWTDWSVQLQGPGERRAGAAAQRDRWVRSMYFNFKGEKRSY